MTELQNRYIMGLDKYSDDVEHAYKLKLGFAPTSLPNRYSTEQNDLYTVGESFHHVSSNPESTPIVAKKDGKIHTDIECYKCHNMCNHDSSCPADESEMTNKNTENNKKDFTFL